MKIYPSNKSQYNKLLEFAREIVDICNEVEVNPIVYGSLAYFVYTKDKKVKINDIDFLIPKKFYNKIIKELEKRKIKYNWDPKWPILRVFKGKLLIELDPIDDWPKQVVRTSQEFSFNGLKLRVVSLDLIKKSYVLSLEKSPTPEKYAEKVRGLMG
jgi:hypothetical protein